MIPICCEQSMYLYPSQGRYFIQCKICKKWWDMTKQQAIQKGYKIERVTNNANNFS